MAHRGAGTDVARDAAARIAQAVRPWRIVLFGSRALGSAGEHSDWDLYVEVDADRAALGAIECEIRALLRGCPCDASLDVKVRAKGDIERRRDDPGTIEWDVAREGTVLYAAPSASITLAPSGRVSEPWHEPPESLQEWLETAERDLEHARLLWSTGKHFAPEICWLSQQTCEKYLKALLVARLVRPVRTHDLGQLLAALRAGGCPLPGLDADCELLAGHAFTPRYPAGLDLGEEDARVAFAAAERVIQVVRDQLPPRVH